MIDILVAFVIATLLVAILGAGIRRIAVGPMLLAMFTVLFLATWAGGIWLVPPGARFAADYVAPFLLVGLMSALLVTAFIPRQPPRTRGEALRQREARRQVVSFVNVFFWLLLAALLAAIATRYLS